VNMGTDKRYGYHQETIPAVQLWTCMRQKHGIWIPSSKRAKHTLGHGHSPEVQLCYVYMGHKGGEAKHVLKGRCAVIPDKEHRRSQELTRY
jgi:hypothetical protein